MVEIIMAKMGDAMEEGTLIKWMKNEGDTVTEGEPVAEIQTDKAIVELIAPVNGKLGGLMLKEGDSAPVGNVVAYVLGEGEKAPVNKQEVKIPVKVEITPKDNAKTVSTDKTIVRDRIFASPVAKRIAEEAGIDISTVVGTGLNGRIIERDLRDLLAEPGVAHHVPQSAFHPFSPPPSLQPPQDACEPRELSRLRKIIAQRTMFSKQTVPHFYVTAEVVMDELLALRVKFNSDDPTAKLSVNDFILRACAIALSKHPEVNTMYYEETLVPLCSINIGVMVSIPDGVIVPVVKDCINKPLRKLSLETKLLVDKARAGSLTPDELTGSSFGISNLGMYDVESFSAIINPPNSAVLAVGSAKKAPYVLPNGAIEARNLMKMTLSADHRVLDGVSAALFLTDVKNLLENPLRLLQ